MGIINNIKESINAHKFNESENEINECITDLMIKLADIRKTADEMTELEIKLEKRSMELDVQINRYKDLAKKAVAAGNEDDARILLKKKHELENNKSNIDSKLDEIHLTAAKARETHDLLVHKINDLKTKLKVLKSRDATADAQKIINSINRSDSVIDQALQEMEFQADLKEAKTDAENYSYSDSNNDEYLSNEIESLKKELGNK